MLLQISASFSGKIRGAEPCQRLNVNRTGNVILAFPATVNDSIFMDCLKLCLLVRG